MINSYARSLPITQSEGWFGKSKEITFDCWDFAGQVSGLYQSNLFLSFPQYLFSFFNIGFVPDYTSVFFDE